MADSAQHWRDDAPERGFARWLYLAVASRLPFRAIRGDQGEPYLERYYLGRFLGQTWYLHRFLASDPDRGLHDHPWRVSRSLILSGVYLEIRQQAGSLFEIRRRFWPLRINRIDGGTRHRIILPSGGEAWTIFSHGARTKGWGFYRSAADGGLRYHPYAIDARDHDPDLWEKLPSRRKGGTGSPQTNIKY
ncbi:hypothetical protein [Acidihalobacter prosperus]|uniref:Uncharacterized protein n=1 Tax=Acidihalobacter prosperus TaxID=160660 RepID=A0A1A6C037_9GAMM|nr:hypothetical protein [Acidihalobacter prosperus]OBS07922.1 hypothetical protein Thpro_022172 [Acidihalobacter prosperus]